jgi:hypothetical protein
MTIDARYCPIGRLLSPAAEFGGDCMHAFRVAGIVVASASALALGLPAALPATAAARFSHPSAAAITSTTAASSGHRPFLVKPGKIFEVTATLSGVRNNDRLALESYFRRVPHHPKGWHVLGSWRLHRGERHFVGLTRGGYPGLFTLRVQFLRHHRLLRGSQSNRFSVRVLGFHVRKLRRPPRSRETLMGPNSARGWDDVECGAAITGGADVYVAAPISTLGNSVPLRVFQVVFARDALPGGNYDNWYVASYLEQVVQPTGSDPNEFTIGAGELSYRPDELGEVPQLEYGNGTEFHQIAWDIEIQEADGTWVWASPTLITPESYIQVDQRGIKSQSSNCETF